MNLIGAYIPLKVKEAIDILSEDNFVTDVLYKIIVWILVLAIIMAIFRVLSRQIIFAVGRWVEFDLKKRIFNHLLKQEIDYFSKQRTGDLISLITNDVQAIRVLYGFAVLNILNAVIAFAVTLPPMFSLNFNITIAFLFVIPLVIMAVVILSDKIKTYQELVYVRLGELSNFLEQSISSITLVKSYAHESSELSRFDKVNYSLKTDYLKLAKIRSLIAPLMRSITSLALIVLMFFGGLAVFKNNFQISDFAAYTLYVQRLLLPISSLGWLITSFYRAEVCQKRIDKVLDRQPKIKDQKSSVEKDEFQEMISLNTLKQTINKGEVIVIVGSIGSGKSYLANQILRLFEVDTDQITIDKQCVKDIKLSSLRTLINLVPQENFLFSTSIAENISYCKTLSHNQIVELAKAVVMHDEILELPNGYNTIVGEKGVTLSGGQKQRVAIARALAVNPEILIFDDAFSSLDNLSTKKIIENILEIREAKTTIFITHKVQLAEFADKVFVMDKMNIVEAGSYNDLLQQNGLFKELLDIDLQKSKKGSDD